MRPSGTTLDWIPTACPMSLGATSARRHCHSLIIVLSIISLSEIICYIIIFYTFDVAQQFPDAAVQAILYHDDRPVAVISACVNFLERA